MLPFGLIFVTISETRGLNTHVFYKCNSVEFERKKSTLFLIGKLVLFGYETFSIVEANMYREEKKLIASRKQDSRKIQK